MISNTVLGFALTWYSYFQYTLPLQLVRDHWTLCENEVTTIKPISDIIYSASTLIVCFLLTRLTHHCPFAIFLPSYVGCDDDHAQCRSGNTLLLEVNFQVRRLKGLVLHSNIAGFCYCFCPIQNQQITFKIPCLVDFQQEYDKSNKDSRRMV